MSNLLQYGAYVFPNTFSYSDLSNAWSSNATKSPHAHGANLATPWRKERTVDVVGTLLKDTVSTLEAKLDALRTALDVQPQSLWVRSDRFLRNAVCDNAPESYQPNWAGRIADVKLHFTTGDPFYYGASNNSPTHAIAANPATFSITPGGNTKAAPVLTITFSSSGTLIGTISNSATGETMYLNGAVVPSSGTLVIDSLNQSVTVGSLDGTYLFDGVFLHLAPGVLNTFTVNMTAGSISNVGVQWYDRYV